LLFLELPLTCGIAIQFTDSYPFIGWGKDIDFLHSRYMTVTQTFPGITVRLMSTFASLVMCVGL
jgi:hypothetical protein